MHSSETVTQADGTVWITHHSTRPFPWTSFFFFLGCGLFITSPVIVLFAMLPALVGIIAFVAVVALVTLLFCGLSREF